jgi:DNA-binding MarR family transcriptional regulator
MQEYGFDAKCGKGDFSVFKLKREFYFVNKFQCAIETHIVYVYMHVMTESPANIKQFDATDLAMCTCANLRKAARSVTKAFDDALRPFDLRATQFTLLATLSNTKKRPLTQLADALGMDRTTLTRNLQPLDRRGLIRIESEKDLRVKNVSITQGGHKLFEDALPEWEKMQRKISGKLGQERWSGFIDDLTATTSISQEN